MPSSQVPPLWQGLPAHSSMLTLHMLPVGGEGLRYQACHPEPTPPFVGLSFPMLICDILSYGKLLYVAMSHMTVAPVASGSRVFQPSYRLIR